jgi:hypothetical protein
VIIREKKKSMYLVKKEISFREGRSVYYPLSISLTPLTPPSLRSFLPGILNNCGVSKNIL